jgi:hypothetical protein
MIVNIDFAKLFATVSDRIAVSLVIGVVGFVAGRLWKSVLKPWMRNAWYSGIRLAPRYVGEFTFKGQTLNDLIEIRQKADRVQGTMTFPSGRQGVYRFEGRIIANVVRGTYEGVRMAPHSHGAFLLEIAGRELNGRFIESYDGQIVEASYKWKPKD